MARGKICATRHAICISWVCLVDFDGRREMSSLSLKTVVIHKSVTSLVMETNICGKEGLFIGLRILNLGRHCKNCFRVYACCFVNINTATILACYDRSAKFYSLILIFSTLCIVHDLIFQRKLSRRRLPITFVYFVSHASAQALRPITFTQRFRTTRHLIFIQLL